MFIQQVKCDVCGKVSDFKDHEAKLLRMTLRPAYHTQFGMESDFNLRDVGFKPADDGKEECIAFYDMCPDCLQKFVAFLNHENTH